MIGGVLCGSHVPPQIISSSNKLLLRFHSDSGDNDIGFRIKVEKGNCINNQNTVQETKHKICLTMYL